MSTPRLCFLILYALLALVGLFTAAASDNFGVSVFAFGLIGFGVIGAYGTIGRHFDTPDVVS